MCLEVGGGGYARPLAGIERPDRDFGDRYQRAAATVHRPCPRRVQLGDLLGSRPLPAAGLPGHDGSGAHGEGAITFPARRHDAPLPFGEVREAGRVGEDVAGTAGNVGAFSYLGHLSGGSKDRAVITAAGRRLAAVPGVARVQPPACNPAGDAAVILLYPATAPQAAATGSLVSHLRATVIPRAAAGSGVNVLIGGETAAGTDASASLSQRLPLVTGLVIVLSFILLMTALRSVAIPLTAAVMNLLSIGAAYGAIVAVYQRGWLAPVFAVSRTGPIDPWIPLMMFTITFGLSMDYEVFLLSRIQEEWHRSGDPGAAVADGIAATGRVITAAAAIMICVFGSFVIGDPLHILDVFGLGLAVAILIDATVVRMVLVPAIMQLPGQANCWFPRWLDRAVPHLDVDAGPADGEARYGEQPESSQARARSRRSAWRCHSGGCFVARADAVDLAYWVSANHPTTLTLPSVHRWHSVVGSVITQCGWPAAQIPCVVSLVIV